MTRGPQPTIDESGKVVEPIHILSLGAGVQSSALAFMSAVGEVTPMPIAGIFADTQGEPGSVYHWLSYLCGVEVKFDSEGKPFVDAGIYKSGVLPFPVRIVTEGSLAKKCITPYRSEKNKKMTTSGIPAFIKNPDGSLSMMRRQCTRDFKVDPVTKAVNVLRRERGNAPARLWIGISTDEVFRAKEHRNAPRIVNRHPLLERRFNRANCQTWIEDNGYPMPPRSACTYCPYHNNAEWRRLRDEEPKDFAEAVEFERQLQETQTDTTLIGMPFLHRSLVPLAEVDFSTEEEKGQGNLFLNECEGMCGV